MKPRPPASGRSARRWILTGLLPLRALPGLWRRPWPRIVKAFLTLMAALWTVIEAGVALAAVTWLTPLDWEWDGGFPPVLTWHKTLPDYAALEEHRSQQSAEGSATTTPAGRVPYWTGFRGPRRDGHYTEQPVNTEWPTGGLAPLWKQPIGGGYASFAVAQGRAFTIEQRREQESVVAYDFSSGRELWAQSYLARFDEAMGGEGPRATPAWCENRVFALGATGWLNCLDADTGTVLWRTNILEANNAPNLHWAQSASPLTVSNLVIVSPGGSPDRSVAAYDQATGALRWHAGAGEAAYSSPMLANLLGVEQLVVAVKNRVLGMRWQDGALLWEFPWRVQQNNANIAQPIVTASNRLVLSAGYGTGAVAIELSHREEAWSATEVWRSRHLKNKFSSSVLFEGHLYGLDESILTCLDAATGEVAWKDGRYGYGQLLLASGCLVILSGDGDLALVRATPDSHQVLSRFPALPGKTWNHPALADGILLIRNAVEMAAYDLRTGAAASP